MTAPSWKVFAYFIGGVLVGCGLGVGAELTASAHMDVLSVMMTMCGVASIALGTMLAIGELW